MQTHFKQATWKMGLLLALVLVAVEAITVVGARNDWRIFTNICGLVSLVVVCACVLYGFIARIGTIGRVIWLSIIFGYVIFLLVEFYKFFPGAD